MTKDEVTKLTDAELTMLYSASHALDCATRTVSAAECTCFKALVYEETERRDQHRELTAEEKFPREDWQYDVANGDTKLGYAEWVEHNVAAESTKRVWERRYQLHEALDMELHNTCLANALTDEAEAELGLTEIECAGDVFLDGQEIVVRFTEL